MGGEGYDEKPLHEVTVNDYFLSEAEVTIKQYNLFCSATDRSLKPGEDNHPVTGVSWEDAVAYCEWITGQRPGNYRLPREAEWEFAARGGNKEKDKGYTYAGSNELDEVAWHYGNSSSGTQAVGQKRPNGLGFYDMSGNVWEWCEDWYGDYPTGPLKDPKGPDTGLHRVLRGGSWDYYASTAACPIATASAPPSATALSAFASPRAVLDEPEGVDSPLTFSVSRP